MVSGHLLGNSLGNSAATVVAILVLGGEPERDTYAVQLAQEVPGVDVYVSSPGGDAEQRLEPLQREGRLRLSWEAVDTVTNFSTLYRPLRNAGVGRVLLVTSPYHMPRALMVGGIMLGSGGIAVEAWPVPGGISAPPEAGWRIFRDKLRAWAWRLLGFDFLWAAWAVKRWGVACVLVFSVSVILVPLALIKAAPLLFSRRSRLRKWWIGTGSERSSDDHSPYSV